MRGSLAALTAIGVSALVTSAASAAPAQPFFTALPASGTTQLATERGYATATTLPSGKVLIAGGYNGTGFLNSIELFDPAGPSFGSVSATSERAYAVAAPLPGGHVLFAGGYPTYQFQTASLFDPSDNSITNLVAAAPTQPTAARAGAVAAPLPDGKVLIAGGTPNFPPTGAVRTAEIFDPADNSFTALPASGNTQLTVARRGAVAAPLPDGKVLIAGGTENLDDGTLLRSAEIFDPADDSFTALPASGNTQLATGRITAVAAALPDGQVLITGGWDGVSTALATAELFDPDTNTFSSLPASGNTQLATGRRDPVAAVLHDGRVLITGGGSAGSGSFLKTAELFTPAPAARATGTDLGSLVVGTPSANRTVTVTNKGAQDLVITPGTLSVTSASGAAGDFTLVDETCAGATLSYKDTCTITVRFTPSATGARSATIDLPDNEPSGTGTIKLTGTGLPIPPPPAPAHGDPPGGTSSGAPAPATTSAKVTPKARCTARRSAKTKRTRITCTVTGLTASGAKARLTRQGKTIGSARLTASGRLVITTKARVKPGTYRLTIGTTKLTVRVR
ncbi:MAG: kelch repeat-containing protein [Candidatus Nanopelagicales bacterium]